MRVLPFFCLLITTSFCLGQDNVLDIEKYRDCQIKIPIKHTKFKQFEDRQVANKLAGKELIIIDTKNDGRVKRINRGFIGIYTESKEMATFFEPTESVISMDNKYHVYLLYNNRNTYCYDAVCFDEKDGLPKKNIELICPTQNVLASQYFGNGILAIENDQYELATKWLEMTVQKDTLFCDAWNSLGIAHQMAGNFEKSYWSYINALAIDSTNYMSWLNLNQIFLLSGDTIDATKSLEHLVKNVPYFEQGYKELHLGYLNQGDSAKAKEVLIKAQLNGVEIDMEEN